MAKKTVRKAAIQKAVANRSERYAEAAVLSDQGQLLMKSCGSQGNNALELRDSFRAQCAITKAEVICYEADLAVCRVVVKVLGAAAEIQFKSSRQVIVVHTQSEQKLEEYQVKVKPTKVRKPQI
jgi:hypothetical protein